ncbi:F0F1 ATP synthase subunit delta [Galbitalea soli]|uniref:ATP synthase subunit delta n=1 Tax=Galbitalea soli TaxID=1268042 RepID=A0A7C9TPS2_9MICO|nr:F0F1 ATP synthase subunit delta [Galbitalea soli]NEM90459.1 F0F1 ATP synthase subunit delta [Galbitalea soli]NYJ31171.1 F-type H+-transporting ATPase subunit delta [Galbitalea soli]
MGSATREALADAIAALNAVAGAADLATGEQLLQAAVTIGGSAPLRAALADDSAEKSDKRGIVDALFGGFTDRARAVLGAIADARWSSDADLVAAVEELGIRAIAESAPSSVSIEGELFAFAAAVRSDAELELAVSSKLGSTESKVALVERLLSGKASVQTIAILRALVQQPGERRIGELIRYATSTVADQAGLAIATITAAKPIPATQLTRLVKGLSAQYGRELKVNQVVDPAILGGIRVQVGDDVIDGSVATRLNDLRLQLAR